MRCPYCGYADTQVKDTRPIENGNGIRRRRSCPSCDKRFNTLESVQLREMVILKRNNNKEPFSLQKLQMSLEACLCKTPDYHRVETIAIDVQKRLEEQGEQYIKSNVIGEMVMDILKDLNKIAYVRFASVYRSFKEVDDYDKFIATIPD